MFFSSLIPLATAHADATDDALNSMAAILNKVPDGALPFSANEFVTYKDLIKSCEKAGNFDQMILCIDNAAKDQKIADAAGVPSWFPQMLDVYFDIKKKDYWGLLSDAGEAVACAAAEVLAGGFDICGVIKDLIKTAKALADAAEAVGKFFSDLGSALGNLAGDIVCLFGGCGDKPPPNPTKLAYDNYYFPRLSEGLSRRMSDPATWKSYAGATPTDANASIISAGVKAGFSQAGMTAALKIFWEAVYTQWDAKISTEAVKASKNAASTFSTPSVFSKYVEAGRAVWFPSLALGGSLSHPVLVSVAPLIAPGVDACRDAVEKAGGKQVDDWINAGRPEKTGIPAPWGNYLELCNSINYKLRDEQLPWAGQKAIDESGCTFGSGKYQCGNVSTTKKCRNGRFTLGLAPNDCINNGPDEGELDSHIYLCGPKPYVCKMYSPKQKVPSNCKIASQSDLLPGQQCLVESSNGLGIGGGAPADAKTIAPPPPPSSGLLRAPPVMQNMPALKPAAPLALPPGPGIRTTAPTMAEPVISAPMLAPETAPTAAPVIAPVIAPSRVSLPTERTR